MEKYDWGTFTDFLGTYEIKDTYKFIQWFREKCYYLAIKSLGKLFKEAESLEMDHHLDDLFELEATFFELNFFIQERKEGVFQITDVDLDKAGAKFTNHIFNKFLFNLSELGMVALLYDKEKEDFFWKINK